MDDTQANQRVKQPDVVTSPPIYLEQTITATSSANSNQIAGGQYFTGTILNKSTSSTLDAILIDGGTSTPWPIPPNSSLTLKGQRCTAVQIQLDALNSSASIAYVLNGRWLVPLTVEARDAIEKSAEVFFRVKTPPQTTGLAVSSFSVTGPIIVNPQLIYQISTVSPFILSPTLNAPVATG